MVIIDHHMTGTDNNHDHNADHDGDNKNVIGRGYAHLIIFAFVSCMSCHEMHCQCSIGVVVAI